jgi:hypothetical protein
MAEETNEGAAYLRALKLTAPSDAATAVAPARETGLEEQAPSGGVADSGERFQGAEKRRSRRYRCEGSAQLREEGRAEVRTWATFSDVSLHGCYVEAQSTYPARTILHMKLKANDFRVEGKGIVRVNYPYLGMGIAFADMSAENLAQLRGLLSTISRPTVVMGPGTASSRASGGTLEVPLISDPASAVRALTEFFENRQMLMR